MMAENRIPDVIKFPYDEYSLGKKILLLNARHAELQLAKKVEQRRDICLFLPIRH